MRINKLLFVITASLGPTHLMGASKTVKSVASVSTKIGRHHVHTYTRKVSFDEIYNRLQVAGALLFQATGVGVKLPGVRLPGHINFSHELVVPEPSDFNLLAKQLGVHDQFVVGGFSVRSNKALERESRQVTAIDYSPILELHPGPWVGIEALLLPQSLRNAAVLHRVGFLSRLEAYINGQTTLRLPPGTILGSDLGVWSGVNFRVADIHAKSNLSSALKILIDSAPNMSNIDQLLRSKEGEEFARSVSRAFRIYDMVGYLGNHDETTREEDMLREKRDRDPLSYITIGPRTFVLRFYREFIKLIELFPDNVRAEWRAAIAEFMLGELANIGPEEHSRGFRTIRVGDAFRDHFASIRENARNCAETINAPNSLFYVDVVGVVPMAPTPPQLQ